MSDIKTFTIIKTVPGTVLFNLRPASNPSLVRKVILTDQNPKQVLPVDWAMGIFANPSLYSLYQGKKFTFNDNELAAKMAFESNVYFDDTLDFEPAIPDRTNTIFATLKSGNRAAILKAIEDNGAEVVKEVAIAKSQDLTTGVIKVLESIFKIQFTVDGE